MIWEKDSIRRIITAVCENEACKRTFGDRFPGNGEFINPSVRRNKLAHRLIMAQLELGESSARNAGAKKSRKWDSTTKDMEEEYDADLRTLHQASANHPITSIEKALMEKFPMHMLQQSTDPVDVNNCEPEKDAVCVYYAPGEARVC